MEFILQWFIFSELFYSRYILVIVTALINVLDLRWLYLLSLLLLFLAYSDIMLDTCNVHVCIDPRT